MNFKLSPIPIRAEEFLRWQKFLSLLALWAVKFHNHKWTLGIQTWGGSIDIHWHNHGCIRFDPYPAVFWKRDRVFNCPACRTFWLRETKSWISNRVTKNQKALTMCLDADWLIRSDKSNEISWPENSCRSCISNCEPAILCSDKWYGTKIHWCWIGWCK